MKTITLFGFAMFIFTATFSQPKPAEVRVVDKSTILEKTVVDSASVRALYAVTQPVSENKKTHEQIDTMTLDIGQKVSRYYNRTRQMQDSIFSSYFISLAPSIKSMSIIKDQDISLDNNPGKTETTVYKGEKTVYFKKHSENIVITLDTESMGSNKYKCEEDIKHDWKITSDTLTVLGYVCQKATTSFRGRNYEAWFSPEIPTSDGPWKFYGLPGLIMKVGDSENLFNFQIIGLEKLNPPLDITETNEKYVKTSLKNMYKLRSSNFDKTSVNFDGGNLTLLTVQTKRTYLPIELDF